MTNGVALDLNLNPSEVVLPETAMPVSDSELVRAVLDGDETAFGLIFERHRSFVVRLVCRFFRRREIVEELVQQIFTKAYFSLKDFRGERDQSFSAWLSRLTVNVCYDEMRRRQRRPESVFAELSENELNYLENVVCSSLNNNESALANRDLAEKLLACLDARDRLALTLFHTEDLSTAEIAKCIGWSEVNVRARLSRTRKFLRNLLEKLK